jgi:phosphoribosylformylglycinamidine synthase subunit PurL
MDALTKNELKYLEQELKRKANETERDAVGAQWSEHCSYKSSKKYLQLLPTKGKHVVVGPGYDAGVLDVGDGYILTVHIESHNHPSAIEPFGGAATGVGGIIRDIMSMGTRPIAVLDALRFSPIKDNNNNQYVAKSKWLFKNVVKGIADYGNCIGIPTVGGEIEFDPSFQDYCLVDVAAIGFGRREDIITNQAEADDIIILAGGPTGRDGIRGASFASKALEEENRSAVQIPDPFLEKLLLEATMEAVKQDCLKCIKDLGGGGLSCCLSETSDNLGKGFDIELTKIHTRESHMMPNEIMISESQERMLYITDKQKLSILQLILSKYGIKHSILGTVQEHQDLVIRHSGKVIMQMPSHLIAHAPLADRVAKRPTYIDKLKKTVKRPSQPSNLGKVLLSLLANPTIASKQWVYQQYDHEVGIRTVIKPGTADAAVMRLDNGKFVAVKLDGNSKHCYLDPYQGTLGCLSEGLRNIVCTGAEPIGVVDHLQFASPEDPEIYWTFVQTVNAIVDYCRFMDIPVVGGKVSFYNETAKGPIKPSPVIGTLGLVESESFLTQMALSSNESIFILGHTQPEMGGSEYYEYFHKITGGTVPQVDLKADRQNRNAVIDLTKEGLVSCAHDCSNGGIAVALVEMAIAGSIGFTVQLDSVPNSCKQIDELLFSETQSRYIIASKDPENVHKVLSAKGVTFAEIGKTMPTKVEFVKGRRHMIRLSLKRLQSNFYSLEKRL